MVETFFVLSAGVAGGIGVGLFPPFGARRFLWALVLALTLPGTLGYMWISAPVSLMGG